VSSHGKRFFSEVEALIVVLGVDWVSSFLGVLSVCPRLLSGNADLVISEFEEVYGDGDSLE